MSNLQDLRRKLKKKAEDAIENGFRNPLDFVPKVGSTNVRFLPAINEEDLFYHTHAYHYFPNNGGRFIYTPRRFNVDGIEKEDPVDVAVRQWYILAEKQGDADIKKYASALKRKRHYFFNIILLDEEDETRKYRVLVDRSNDGKLARIICTTMGIPFFKDITDQWVDQSSLAIDEDKDYFDLIDMQEGHDFKIKMVKDGENQWDITYADSFAIKKARALSADEQKLADGRVDLKTHINYETNYLVLEQALNDFIESIGKNVAGTDEEVEAKDEKLPPLDKEVKEEIKEEAKKAVDKAKKKKVVDADDEQGMKEMLDELDD